MTCRVFSGLAAVSALAMLAVAPAQAQGLGQPSGASTGGLNKAIANRGGPSAPQGANKLSNGQPSSANTAANVHALSVYLQWRRKCLDNILPQCP